MTVLSIASLVNFGDFISFPKTYNDDKRERTVKEKNSQVTLENGGVQQEMAELNALSF